MEQIKYTDLRPGDTISWQIELNGENTVQFGIIKTFHASSIDPIGMIETTSGKMVHRSKQIHKLVSSQLIKVVNK